MKIRSNKIDPPKKKKTEAELTFKRGSEERTYTPARTLTGDKRYGKENTKNKDAKFIEDARSKKQDIAYKNGKPYRAGYTETKKNPDQVKVKMNVTPDIKKVEMKKVTTKKPETKPVSGKKIGKSSGKLKPMAMTYGTDSPKSGGTKYKNKVKALKRK